MLIVETGEGGTIEALYALDEDDELAEIAKGRIGTPPSPAVAGSELYVCPYHGLASTTHLSVRRGNDPLLHQGQL